MTIAIRQLELSLLPERFAISRLASNAPFPDWVTQGAFYSVTRTSDELSIVAEESSVPAGTLSETGWRVLKVQGPFVLSEVGVLASLASPLAAARVSLFVVSTFDTDYLLVTQEQLASAIAALDRAGHLIHRSDQQ
ncbi:MAG: ACT domain-containing protein [Candidatus Acidiferrales bacterium]